MVNGIDQAPMIGRPGETVGIAAALVPNQFNLYILSPFNGRIQIKGNHLTARFRTSRHIHH